MSGKIVKKEPLAKAEPEGHTELKVDIDRLRRIIDIFDKARMKCSKEGFDQVEIYFGLCLFLIAIEEGAKMHFTEEELEAIHKKAKEILEDPFVRTVELRLF